MEIFDKNSEGIVVLSLFDGLSCGMIALERAGIKVAKYFASEVDKHAIKVSKHNYPSIIHIGDVTKVIYKGGILYTDSGSYEVPRIDLVIGGSPCQSISNLGDGTGLEGKSSLFFHFLRIKKEVEESNNNLKFLLENVVGNKKSIQVISDLMGVDPVLFNSSLVSAQTRARYYWTNIPFNLPEDKGIELKHILDKTPSGAEKLSPGRLRWLLSEKGQLTVSKGYAKIDPIKAGCLTARSDASWNCNYVTRNGEITKLTPEEYEKLQTVPVGYTSCVSNSERYKMLGNGWTVDVIAHIFKNLRQN